MAIFSRYDLANISRRTSDNYHGENFEFIARKIHSPLERDFHGINLAHKKAGSLSYPLSQKRHVLYEKLMTELRKKSPQEYAGVYMRL